MKKYFLVTVLSLGSLTAFAQETETEAAVQSETEVEAESVTIDAENVEIQAESVENQAAAEAEGEMTAQDEFSAVEASELPAAITEALSADYPEVEISQAYVNEQGQYKLEVAKEDGSTLELYADSEGNWLEM